uniref:Uncharacterized protein LOC111118749 n=1 Tax=Crassostrea virginica TaxID=6565 RepID=A0A8B8CE62_CRAVI|nr:uncharacterized protein LOC111118749 [Crassostrea virginica]
MSTQPKTTDADLTTKSTHDIRIKRSFESTTLSQSTQHTLEVTSKSENLSDLQTESLISSKTVQTENESLHPTTTTTATKSTTTATKSTTTATSKENSKDLQCPLWLYSGNDSKTKLYGMLEKPCWSESLQELDQDDTRHYIRLYEERLYETIDMTGTLINNITEKLYRSNSDLMEALKNIDFNCFVSRGGQENQTSVEEQSLKLHHSLLKSYAILDVLISEENETETSSSLDRFILGNVSELKKRIRVLVCYIEILLRNKDYSIDSFPLFSKRDGNFNFFDNRIPLSSNFFVYIHQVFKYLRESAVNEAKVLWSLV